MELFDKRFVHFMWEDELEGKEGFFADDIATLEGFVKSKSSVFTVRKSKFKDKPFSIKNGGFRFFYYDPNYKCKCAYAEGKQIQHTLFSNDWIDCKGEPNWENESNFRIKPEEPNARPFEDITEINKQFETLLHELKDKEIISEWYYNGEYHWKYAEQKEPNWEQCTGCAYDDVSPVQRL